MEVRHIAGALIAMLATATTWACEAKTVGKSYGWSVLDTEPDKGRRVSTIVLDDDLKSIKLGCSGGDWTIDIDRTPILDEGVHAISGFVLRYRINGDAERSFDGQGLDGLSFYSLHANAVVEALAVPDATFTFNLSPNDPRSQTTTLRITGTREAIAPFLSRCPLT